MSKEFFEAFKNEHPGNWDLWLGQPMFYDFAFFVNRTAEEHAEHNRRLSRLKSKV